LTRALPRFALLAALLPACARRPPPGAQATTVSAWAMNGAHPPGADDAALRCLAPFGPSGARCDDLSPDGRPLSAAQQVQLEQLLDDPASFLSGVDAGCFAPRHAFVWTRADGGRARQLSVSLGCAAVLADPPLNPRAPAAKPVPLAPAALDALRALCGATGLPGCAEPLRPE
jgi:hypothetical protein